MLKTAQFMLFFDFLVSEGYLGCSEQASKTLVNRALAIAIVFS